jgi:hypothetical protein
MSNGSVIDKQNYSYDYGRKFFIVHAYVGSTKEVTLLRVG